MADQNHPFYVFEINVGHLYGEVLLNGWPIYRDLAVEPGLTQTRANPWIVEGHNELSLRLSPLPSGLDPEAFFTFQAYKVASEDEPLHVDHLLWRYDWRHAESPLLAKRRMPVFVHHFWVRKAFGRFSWEDAPPYREEDRQAVEGMVATLHHAFEARDADTVVDLLDHKLSELGRSLDIPADEMRSKQHKFLSNLFSKQDWAVAPLSFPLFLLPRANGRSVEVITDRGRPPIIGEAGQILYSLDVWASRIDGNWAVVR